MRKRSVDQHNKFSEHRNRYRESYIRNDLRV